MQRLNHVCVICRRLIAAPSFHPAFVGRSISTASTNSKRVPSHDRGTQDCPPSPTRTFRPKKDRVSTERRSDPLTDPRETWQSHHRVPTTDMIIRRKAKTGFYDETSPHDKARSELDRLLKRLGQDSKSVPAIYDDFEKFLAKYMPKKQRFQQNWLLMKHQLPRRMFGAILQHRNTIEGLPSVAEVLVRFNECGFNDDMLWANAMFEYIRTECYDEAIELWRTRLTSKKKYPESFLPTRAPPDSDSARPSENDIDTSPAQQPFDSLWYAAVAAATAYIQYRHLLMIPTHLPDLLRFLAPDVGNISWLIPQTSDVRYILVSNDVSEELVKFITARLWELRPYAEGPPSHRPLFDKAFFAASNGDLEQVRQIYRESKERILEKDRRRSYYVSFINAFLQCGSHQDGDIVWNEMLGAGSIPNLKIWGSWLDGCAKARDVNLFEKSWNNMLEAKFEPDTVCWTIRMQLHFFLNDPESAKLCLQGMVDRKVPIETGTVNVAIQELNNAGLYQDAADLINWALQHGIRADTVTYNLMLDFRVKMKDYQGVLRTLKTMNDTNVPTDLISYGVIIRGLYQQSNTQPDISIVQAVLEEMKTKNITPNLHFWNTIIFAMLDKFYDIEGALYILSLMPNDAWRGSAHTSAIFIRYYSKTSNLPAIEAVWENMRKNQVVPDEIIYNSTVVAYAKAGVKDMMMRYLEPMFKQRKTVITVTYIWVIKCLIRHEDFVTAHKIFTQMQSRNVDIASNKELMDLYHEVRRNSTDAN